MRNAILFSLVMMTMVSCTNILDPQFSAWGSEKALGTYRLNATLEEEIFELDPNNNIDVFWWVSRKIDYMFDNKSSILLKNDDWKLPQETIDDGGGDCEDYAILVSFIYEYYFNMDCDVILIEYGEYLAHVIVRLEGTYYEPQRITDQPTEDELLKKSLGGVIRKVMEVEEALHIADSGVFRTL